MKIKSTNAVRFGERCYYLEGNEKVAWCAASFAPRCPICKMHLQYNPDEDLFSCYDCDRIFSESELNKVA